jgi:Protein of unknown function (DUF3306)
MANDDAPSGFLSRWSRRKSEVREGRLSEEAAPIAAVAAPVAAPTHVPATAPLVAATPSASTIATPEAKPAPTLADAQQLTPESDFSGFMARGVTPDVKNAAMKKLFADPHFNVMDRMDIYIDDYSQPDPLPLAMLRQMASAKTLNLFDDDEAEAVPPSNAQAQTTDAPKLTDPAAEPNSAEVQPKIS